MELRIARHVYGGTGGYTKDVLEYFEEYLLGGTWKPVPIVEIQHDSTDDAPA